MKTRKKFYSNICVQMLRLQYTAQKCAELNRRFFLYGNTQNHVVYSAAVANGEAVLQCIFMLVKPFITALGPLKGCNNL